MNRTTTFLMACFFLLLCVSASSDASEILVIKSADIKPYNEALEGFKSSCDCIVTEITPSDAGQPELSKALSEINPDAVLAIGADALKHAQAVNDLPVIYAMVPYSPSFVSMRKNISGVSMHISAEKYLDMMTVVFPNAKRIGLIYDPGKSETIVNEALQSAGKRNLEIIAKKARRAGDVPALIDSLKRKIDVLWMLPDTTVVNSETFNYMLMFSFLNEVPVVTFSKKYVEMGASAGLNIVPFDIGVQAGEIARSLVKGKGAVPPVRVSARKTVLTINKKVVRKLRIKIRDDILKGAEYVE